MLDRILHWSLSNKLLVLILIAALIAWGSWSYTRLPIDAVPDITNNQVQIINSCPSASASDIERLVTFPLEQGMATIPGIEEIRSFSRSGLSVVTIIFKDDIDPYWARQQISERLIGLQSELPPNMGTPEMAPMTTGLGEIYQYVIRPKPGFEHLYSPTELRTIQDWIVRRQLLGTPGIADVSSFGGKLKQWEIAIDPERIKSLGIDISTVVKAIEDNNSNAGGAYLDKNPTVYFIRSEGLLKTKDEIGKIVVKHQEAGASIKVSDVASIQEGFAIRYGALTFNNEGEMVGGIVMMLKGENSSQVIEQVKKRIETINKNLPKGLIIEAYLDRTHLVNKAIGTVGKNLLEGALIVIFVLVLFLGNFRAGMLVASVIPLSLLFAIGMMQWLGISGNLMSLGALDFGLIVDGAVIIVEASLHYLHLHPYKNQQEKDQRIFESASRIRNAAAFGELIILIVYLPILSLQGVEGKMFAPMAQTVAFAILGAFILSLTYVPVMSSWFLTSESHRLQRWSDQWFQRISVAYAHLLATCIRKTRWVIALSLSLLVSAAIGFYFLGGEFIPTLEEGDFAVETRLLPGSSLQKTIDVTLQASTLLKDSFPEVKKVVGKIGSSEIPTDPMPLEACDLMVILKDKEEWVSAESRDELAEKMQQVLSVIPGVSFGFQQPIQMRFNELMTGVKQDVAVKIVGENLDSLTALAKRMGELVQGVKGVRDVYVEQNTGLPQIVVEWQRSQLSSYSVSIQKANEVLSAAMAGASAGFLYEDEKKIEIVIRLPESKRQLLSVIQDLTVMNEHGKLIPLKQLATIRETTGINQIQRENAKRRAVVAFNVRDRDVESVVHEIQALADQNFKAPVGYYLEYGGQFENLKAANKRLMVAVPIALLLILVLLYFSFQSIRLAILIFTAVPFAAVGGIAALYLRDMPFSISAGVGFIALFGVAVLNGIVLITEFTRMQQHGANSLMYVLLRASARRFRPVLMTAMVASLGFLPMALSNGAGAEVQKPLATVVIGGLFSSTLLTLLVLPAVFALLSRSKIQST
jgi:cobalt-zinc-cadmium resistance protein CzcA